MPGPLARAGLAFALLDENGLVAAANEAFTSLLAASPGKLAGGPLGEILVDLPLDPDELGAVVAGRRRQVRLETRLRRQDGSLFWGSLTLTPAGDVGGRRLALVLLDDTSERRRRDDEQRMLGDLLGAAASEWRATFDAIEMPIFIVGVGGRIERLNRAARLLAGRSFDELLGHRLAEVSDRPLWQEADELIERVGADPRPAGIEVRDGGRTWALAASPGLPDLSDARSIILNVRELTSLVQLQESLRRSQTMAAMGSLVAGVAHEVRNPLFGISAVVDALERRFDHREELAVHLGHLRLELGRLEKLMAELLDFGRPVVPEPEPVLLRQVVDDALAACALQLDRSGVVVDLRSEAGNRPLHLDRQRVCQALVNLVENAIHHAPAHSRLEIATETVERGDRRWSQVTVRDHGPGFRDDDLPRLFEPFFSRRAGGTGLGLPIVARIVEGHDGEVEVGNAAGGGAVARVSFPLPEPPAEEDGP
jgi:PAS domain S-box-containing protein